MEAKLHTLKEQFETDLSSAQNSKELEQIKVKFLGKKGPIQELMKSLKEVSQEERPLVGKKINDFKVFVSETLSATMARAAEQELATQLQEEFVDITLPGRRESLGRKHLLTATLDHMIEILVEMGFSVQYGPDMDTDYYNFEALNFPPDHPARDMQDTFYINDTVLLRTHTSNIQARVMESTTPPIRIIAPGKVYRNEAISARSHVFFQQIEALYIDKEVSFADLLATMEAFLCKVFHQEVKTRVRPSYFPFVEPGMEVDVHCLSCKGIGCGICKHTGWLEVAGAGMVHPEVLKNGNIDPEEYSGYAWGVGVERIAMLLYGVTDIRLFTENHLGFLEQFSMI